MRIEDTEQLRHAVRDTLYARNGVPLPVRGIRRAVAVEVGFNISDDDVGAALEFWRGLTPPQAEYIFDEAGGTRWWRITSAGILAAERKL